MLARRSNKKEEKKEEKKISVKVRVTRCEPPTAVAERLQRQSGRLVAEPRGQSKEEKAGKGRSKQAGDDKLLYCSSGPKYG